MCNALVERTALNIFDARCASAAWQRLHDLIDTLPTRISGILSVENIARGLTHILARLVHDNFRSLNVADILMCGHLLL